jgi:ABC-type microcin C transport system permease subunit YejE
MKVNKYPVGVVSAIIAIVLAARYGAWQSVGGTASVVICGLMLLFGWMAPVQIMRDN